MSEEEVIEVPSEEERKEETGSEQTAQPEPIKVEGVTEEDKAEKGEKEKTSEGKKRAPHLKDALKQVESFGQALGEALQGRANVVMVRVNDESLEHLDMLVDAEITSSRSESAAFLISEGIKANRALFDRIRAITDQIAELREQLRQEVRLTEEPAETEETKAPDAETESAE